MIVFGLLPKLYKAVSTYSNHLKTLAKWQKKWQTGERAGNPLHDCLKIL
jgi:predicted  nucleic acid-binding Zn ribbon protein